MRSLTGIATCALVPEVTGYSAKPSAGAISAKLDGPSGRYGKFIKNGAIDVNLSWELSGNELSYIRAFYRQKAKRGAKPVLLKLILDTNAVGLYFTCFIPKTMRITHVQGSLYRVSVSAEIERQDYL
jgi:hypothetical protein